MSYVHNGDALDFLSEIPDNFADVVLTDPPYGINTKSDGKGKLNPWADLMNSAHFYRLWFAECRRILKPTGSLWSFLNWRSIPTFMKAGADLNWAPTSMLVWDKEWIGPGGKKGLRPCYELVGLWAMPEFAIANRSLRDIKRSKWSSHKPHGHPAEKPSELCLWILRDVCRADATFKVVDPFAGSGTTAEAAAVCGAGFWGCEQDPRWAKATRERLAEANRIRALAED